MRRIWFGLFITIALAAPVWAAPLVPQQVLQEAAQRCETRMKRLKNDISIPQAFLSEKENCLIENFAQVLVESVDNDEVEIFSLEIEKCAIRAQQGPDKTFDQEAYKECVIEALNVETAAMVAPCQILSTHISTGIGREDCEKTARTLYAQRVAEVLHPPSSRSRQLYAVAVTFLAPHLTLSYFVAMAVFLFYLADMLWREELRMVQLLVSIGIAGAVVFMQFWKDFLLAPVVIILLFLILLIHNRWPKPPEPLEQIPLDHLL